MPLGRFANETNTACTAPLLDESLFGKTGGYQAGRYCGLGSFEDGTTCCFPCPIQDWVYPASWEPQLRAPNYLSILSVILCSFLLLSFAVLPPEQTHRHYLSVGLLFPVLFISFSFVIPVAVNPSLCYDAITPNDMYSSMSCAWTGSLVTLGGLGCVIWVFLRSLWLHVRICWDKDPGKKFKWGSILVGTLLPLAFLIAILTATGFSYRMGQTCLPNHENAIVAFWVWLVIFAIAGFLLQVVTTSYCVYVYVRTLRRERRHSASTNSFQRRRAVSNNETWKNIKRLFVLQWRNILVSVFVMIGSISFFIVFWTQDGKLGRVFNDPENIKPVKTWIICQTLSRGDKEECRKYVGSFTVNRHAVLTSLILASLVGIEIFILLFRLSMLRAWHTIFRRLSRRTLGRAPTPQLTSLENPEKYLRTPTPTKQAVFSAFSTETPTSDAVWPDTARNSTTVAPTTSDASTLGHRPAYERMTSETGLLAAPDAPRFQGLFESGGLNSAEVSRAGTPQAGGAMDANSALASHASFTPSRDAPSPPPRGVPLSRGGFGDGVSGGVPRRALSLGRGRGDGRAGDSGIGTDVRVRISTPLPGTFVHVDGAFIDGRGRGK